MNEPLIEVSMDGQDWHDYGDATWLFPGSASYYRYERRDGVVVRTPPPDVPLREYLRIGPKGGPGVYQDEDRWSQPVDHYTANDWYCIEPDRWATIKAWQAPLSTDAEAMIRGGKSIEEVMAKVGVEIQARFDLVGVKATTLWQLDVPHRPDNRWDDQRRIVSPMGIESDYGYREWTWFECFVLHPMSLIEAALKNLEAENRRDLTAPPL